MIVLIGFAAFSVSEISQEEANKKSVSRTSEKPRELEPDETRVTGKVTYYEQGPTDEVTGEKPGTATIAVGSQKAFLRWKAAAEANPPEGTEEKPLTKSTKPSEVEVKTTATGKLDVILNKNRDIICLLYPQSVNWSSNDFIDIYGVFDCKRFIKTGEVKADIGLIGFGSNSIKCDDENACEEFTALQPVYN